MYVRLAEPKKCIPHKFQRQTPHTITRPPSHHYHFHPLLLYPEPHHAIFSQTARINSSFTFLSHFVSTSMRCGAAFNKGMLCIAHHRGPGLDRGVKRIHNQGSHTIRARCHLRQGWCIVANLGGPTAIPPNTWLISVDHNRARSLDVTRNATRDSSRVRRLLPCNPRVSTL